MAISSFEEFLKRASGGVERPRRFSVPAPQPRETAVVEPQAPEQEVFPSVPSSFTEKPYDPTLAGEGLTKRFGDNEYLSFFGYQVDLVRRALEKFQEMNVKLDNKVIKPLFYEPLARKTLQFARQHNIRGFGSLTDEEINTRAKAQAEKAVNEGIGKMAEEMGIGTLGQFAATIGQPTTLDAATFGIGKGLKAVTRAPELLKAARTGEKIEGSLFGKKGIRIVEQLTRVDDVMRDLGRGERVAEKPTLTARVFNRVSPTLATGLKKIEDFGKTIAGSARPTERALNILGEDVANTLRSTAIRLPQSDDVANVLDVLEDFHIQKVLQSGKKVTPDLVYREALKTIRSVSQNLGKGAQLEAITNWLKSAMRIENLTGGKFTVQGIDKVLEGAFGVTRKKALQELRLEGGFVGDITKKTLYKEYKQELSQKLLARDVPQQTVDEILKLSDEIARKHNLVPVVSPSFKVAGEERFARIGGEGLASLQKAEEMITPETALAKIGQMTLGLFDEQSTRYLNLKRQARLAQELTEKVEGSPKQIAEGMRRAWSRVYQITENTTKELGLQQNLWRVMKEEGFGAAIKYIGKKSIPFPHSVQDLSYSDLLKVERDLGLTGFAKAVKQSRQLSFREQGLEFLLQKFSANPVVDSFIRFRNAARFGLNPFFHGYNFVENRILTNLLGWDDIPKSLDRLTSTKFGKDVIEDIHLINKGFKGGDTDTVMKLTGGELKREIERRLQGTRWSKMTARDVFKTLEEVDEEALAMVKGAYKNGVNMTYEGAVRRLRPELQPLIQVVKDSFDHSLRWSSKILFGRNRGALERSINLVLFPTSYNIRNLFNIGLLISRNPVLLPLAARGGWFYKLMEEKSQEELGIPFSERWDLIEKKFPLLKQLDYGAPLGTGGTGAGSQVMALKFLLSLLHTEAPYEEGKAMYEYLHPKKALENPPKFVQDFIQSSAGSWTKMFITKDTITTFKNLEDVLKDIFKKQPTPPKGQL